MGTRLRPLTHEVPKPMIIIRNKPFLYYQIIYLKRSGIKNILLLVGYLGDQIKNYFGDGSIFGLSIKYSEDKHCLGTGGAIKQAAQLLDDSFFLIYGDSFLPIEYDKIFERFIENGKRGLLVISHNSDPFARGNITIDKDSNIIRYEKDGSNSRLKYIDAGVGVLSKDILTFLGQHEITSLEKEGFPELIKHKELAGFITDERFYDIGTVAGLNKFRRRLNDYFPYTM